MLLVSYIDVLCSVVLFAVYQPLSSDSSAELSARRTETTAEKDHVPETSSAAAPSPGEAGNVGASSTDVGQRWRRPSRKSSVSSSATDVLAKLSCVPRRMKSADDVITDV